MSVVFTPNQTIGQGDLDIFLTNAGGFPANAYSITYAIYYVSPGPPETEVLIGSPTRTPVNPTVGEYYASLTVPGTATPGDYRIRWTFQQFASSPPQQVVMEWAVVATGTVLAPPTYSTLTQGMIDKLRLLLRDQCLGGEETIEVSNPLARLQGGRAADASQHALPANVARAALSRAGKVRQKLKLALFVHKPRPPLHPTI